MNNLTEKSARSGQAPAMDGPNIRKILVAVDLSPHSKKTAAYAADFAKSFGASITLVHVFNTEPVRTLNANETREEEKRHNIERKLVALADQVREKYPSCDIRFRDGDPAEEITILAQDIEADLIVTASHHPGFLTRLFGWDQAPRILHRARCPVLIYHEAVE
jgi:nucleotide-binding universal stress UspA family protein